MYTVHYIARSSSFTHSQTNTHRNIGRGIVSQHRVAISVRFRSFRSIHIFKWKRRKKNSQFFFFWLFPSTHLSIEFGIWKRIEKKKFFFRKNSKEKKKEKKWNAIDCSSP